MSFYNLDDYRSISANSLWIYEWRGTIDFDPDRLAQLKFNFLLSESYKKCSLCKDNDRDYVNFYLKKQ